MTAQLLALKFLAILLSPPVVSTQLGMILSPATTLVDMAELGRHVDRSPSQSQPALGTCQVLGMMSGIKTLARRLSGAVLCTTTALVMCSACQVLVGVGARSTCQVLVGYGACSACQVLVGYGAHSTCQVLVGYGAHSACQVLVCAGAHSACQVLVGVGARRAYQVLGGVGVIVCVTWTL